MPYQGSGGRGMRGGAIGAPPVASVEEIAAVEAAGDLINRKWKLAILYVLALAPHRYNALLRVMPGVTPKMLTQQLRALEDAGVILRIEGTGPAKHTEYRLSDAGEQLRPMVATIADFAHQHLVARPSESTAAADSPFRRAG